LRIFSSLLIRGRGNREEKLDGGALVAKARNASKPRRRKRRKRADRFRLSLSITATPENCNRDAAFFSQFSQKNRNRSLSRVNLSALRNINKIVVSFGALDRPLDAGRADADAPKSSENALALERKIRLY
jgi:uncharacterized membrane-anchored protein